MELKRATEKDKVLCAEVLLASGLAKSEEEAKNAVEKEFQRGDHYILAEEDGKPLGLVTWIAQGSPRHELIELYHIGVLPDARRKGVAVKLFEQLEHDANEYLQSEGFHLRKLYLLTHEENVAAKKFYEKVGMHQEATLKDHFGKKPEAVMVKFYEKDATFPNHVSEA